MSIVQTASSPSTIANVNRYLVVSVDTEEEGLWGGNYRVSGNTTRNLRGLARFQDCCERLSVPPTYLIDAPVIYDAEAIALMRRWQDAGRCEVGSHCHPWCNPPLATSAPTSAETYLCNLPVEVQYEKLKWLTDRIADAVGRVPTSYRAGRYGFGPSSAGILEQLGYQVDSSVLPLHEYLSKGGPDFREASRHPFRYFGNDDERHLLEIPVTAGFTRHGYEWQRKLWIALRAKPWRRMRLAGVADYMGIGRRVKLSPEGTRLNDLKRLIDTCYRDGLDTLVLMLHSSSLVAGLSPYATDAAQLDSFYTRLSQMIKHATIQYGYRPVTLTQCAAELTSAGVTAG